VIAEALSGRRAALLFGAFNLLFLFVDVALAHSSFQRSRAEYIPLVVSAVGGGIVLVCAIFTGPLTRTWLWIVSLACVATGVLGLRLHFGSEAHLTLHRLVYSAPLIAPLSYAGLGFLLLAAEHAPGPVQRGRMLQLLSGLGFFGNFALCLLDHAQNGFWAPVEWASVAAGALGGFALTTAALLPHETSGERRFVWGTLGLMTLVGLLGASLHLRANLQNPERPLLQRLQYGAPIFAPMLFVDLVVLGAMGLLARRQGGATPLKPGIAP
jgi:hypothetical protein